MGFQLWQMDDATVILLCDHKYTHSLVVCLKLEGNLVLTDGIRIGSL